MTETNTIEAKTADAPVSPEDRAETWRVMLARVEDLLASRPALRKKLETWAITEQKMGGLDSPRIRFGMFMWHLTWEAMEKARSAEFVAEARAEGNDALTRLRDPAATKGGRAFQRGILRLTRLLIGGAVKRGEIAL